MEHLKAKDGFIFYVSFIIFIILSFLVSYAVQKTFMLGEGIFYSLSFLLYLIPLYFLFELAVFLLSMILNRKILFVKNGRLITIRYFLPAILYIGRLMFWDRDKVENSFIAINNYFVGSVSSKVGSKSILVLLPRCLQNSKCSRNVIEDISNCAGCGMCDIKDLDFLKNKYGIKIYATSGGTLARELVKKYAPTLVVAVACERELVAGIKDTFGIPVYALKNYRPSGPCKDTRVDVAEFEEVIKKYLA